MPFETDADSLDTLKTGLLRDSAACLTTCVVCGAVFDDGEVYPEDGHYYTAQKAARRHAEAAHGSRLEALLEGDDRYVSLTDHQKRLLRLLAAGRSDAEIAAETGATAATVRRQRFAFREKAKAARMYLAIYELAHQNKKQQAAGLLPIHEGVKMLDDRFVITKEENEKFLKTTFESLDPPRLKLWPVKEKKKIAILNVIAGQFEKGRNYTEKEVNAALKAIYPQDHVVLRRYLIEYGYMDREADGSRYWVR